MARIAGVDLPRNKKVEFAIQYIYGIGTFKAKAILTASSVDPNIRVNKLTEEQIIAIRNEISASFIYEMEDYTKLNNNASSISLSIGWKGNMKWIL